ncbi:peptidase A1 family [Salix suchowensis]|nr:peptidase A1 family [Salix suchowensis]
MNATSVTAQVNDIKSRPNMLLWYTADEPDGTSDPLSATADSYDLITSLDGGPLPLQQRQGDRVPPHLTRAQLRKLRVHCVYVGSGHCHAGYLHDRQQCNVLFSMAYTLYPRLRRLRVSANLTTSRYIFNMYPFRCDNCQGEFEDISRRMDEFADRLFVNGRDRMKAVWTVPQAFGLETYWKRLPTGKEFIVQSLLGVNHGGLGIVPWEDPTPADIKASASSLALALPKMTPFIFNPTASFQRTTLNRVDIGLWTVGKETLVVATNMNNAEVSVGLSTLPVGVESSVRIAQVFESAARTSTIIAGLRSKLLVVVLG